MKLSSTLLMLCGIVSVSLFIACNKEDERQPCNQPQTVTLRMHTYKLVDTVATDTFLNFPRLIPLDAQLPVTFTSNSRTARLSLYLSSLNDSTRWLLQADSTRPFLIDTLTFYYNRRLKFISNSCGYIYYYTLTNAKRSSSLGKDSVNILNPEVTNDANVEHVRLYY